MMAEVKHMHLYRDCGVSLYERKWCDQTQDHRIGGRCEACWSRLGYFRQSRIVRKINGRSGSVS